MSHGVVHPRALVLLVALCVVSAAGIPAGAALGTPGAVGTAVQPGPAVPVLDAAADAIDAVRSDAPELLTAVILVALALAVLLLSAALHQSIDRSVIYFGVFTLLYGLRLAGTATTGRVTGLEPINLQRAELAITYAINVPITLFIERVLGRGWYSSITRLRQAWTILAVIGVPMAIWTDAPERLMPVNNVLVIVGMALLSVHLAFVWRRTPQPGIRILSAGIAVLILFVLNNNLSGLGLLPWGEGPEEVGFLALIGCLGYFVARRQLDVQRQLVALDQELKTARAIQSSILPASLPAIRGVELAARYIPMAAVGGDFYDVLTVDDRRFGILVADVSGHGVPAALIASMVKVAISAQSEHANDPGRVLQGMNQILCGKLERQFVTAAYVFFDLDAGRLVGATAGHPPVLTWRAEERRLVELGATGIMLGHFRDAEYTSVEQRIAAGDRVLLYTDGVIEATNRAGEFFDPERLRAFATRDPAQPADLFCADLLDHLTAWSGRGEDAGGFEDDVTLVAARITAD